MHRERRPPRAVRAAKDGAHAGESSFYRERLALAYPAADLEPGRVREQTGVSPLL